MVVPFRCRNYRCRRCAWSVTREDYRRIESGAVSRPDWLYAVLTFDPSTFSTPWEAYKAAGEAWDKRLRRRLERAYGRLDYVQTWERHRNGWPHVNLLFRSDTLLEAVRAAGIERRPVDPRNPRVCRVAHFPKWRPWLAHAAPECGFGLRVWVEVVENERAMAAYLAKVCGEMTRSNLKHGDQLPRGAPRHFRRLRASRGLLPVRSKGDPSWTGVFAPVAPGAFADRETGEIAPGWSDVHRAHAAAWERRTGESASAWWSAFDRGPQASPLDP